MRIAHTGVGGSGGCILSPAWTVSLNPRHLDRSQRRFHRLWRSGEILYLAFAVAFLLFSLPLSFEGVSKASEDVEKGCLCSSVGERASAPRLPPATKPLPLCRRPERSPRTKRLIYCRCLCYCRHSRHKQIRNNNLQIYPLNSPAEPHVKPQNQLTKTKQTRSKLHKSFIQPAILNTETKKAPAKSRGSTFNP
jgi:hypothetical protein